MVLHSVEMEGFPGWETGATAWDLGKVASGQEPPGRKRKRPPRDEVPWIPGRAWTTVLITTTGFGFVHGFTGLGSESVSCILVSFFRAVLHI